MVQGEAGPDCGPRGCPDIGVDPTALASYKASQRTIVHTALLHEQLTP
jgi:hypothetical protein